LPHAASWRIAFVAVFASVWVNQALVWQLLIPGPGELHGSVSSPLQTLTALSYQFYAVVALLGMGVILLRCEIAGRMAAPCPGN
jgi:hypothetical protein